MPERTEIRTIMTEAVFSVDYYDPISKAENLMKREMIRHIPVTHDRKYVGMITQQKINEYNLKRIYDYDSNEVPDENILISDYRRIFVSDLPLIFPEDSIKKATELMVKHKVDVLPVVDWHKNLVGIITSIDLLLFFHKMLSGKN
jgi:acetoin utilization protein AcuB